METNEKPSRETTDAWHDDPSNWKLGVFYYNKKDKRIFCNQKRIRGFGWTINFANPFSVTAFKILLLIVATIIIYSAFS